MALEQKIKSWWSSLSNKDNQIFYLFTAIAVILIIYLFKIRIWKKKKVNFRRSYRRYRPRYRRFRRRYRRRYRRR